MKYYMIKWGVYYFTGLEGNVKWVLNEKDSVKIKDIQLVKDYIEECSDQEKQAITILEISSKELSIKDLWTN